MLNDNHCVTTYGGKENSILDSARMGTIATVTKVISYVTKKIPSIAGSILKSLLGLLWKSGQPETVVWEDFMNDVENLIDKKIDDVLRAQAIAILEGMGNTLEGYHNVLDLWKENPTDEGIKEALRNAFSGANRIMDDEIPKLALIGYEVQTLIVYAQATNLHLLLLKDVVKDGLEWGFPQSIIDTYAELQLERLPEYTDHCVQWYNAGLKSLESRSWDDYNDFRRELTLGVLDIIAVFPTYNYALYPLDAKVELTREIYTKAVNTTAQFGDSLQELEEGLTREKEQKLFTWLRGLKFYTFPYYHSRYDVFIANSVFYSNEIDGKIVESPVYGYFPYPEDYEEFTIMSPPNTFVYKVNAETFQDVSNLDDEPNAVNKIRFHYTDNVERLYYAGESVAPLVNHDVWLPALDGSETPTSSNFSHVLSYMKEHGHGVVSHSTVFGWTHASVESQNIRYGDKITIIPAIKVSQVDDRYEHVLKGPGFTGGDILKIDTNVGELYYNLVRDPENNVPNFFIRIRYAAQNRRTMYINTIGGINPPKVYLSKTMESETPTKYNDFEWSQNILLEGSSHLHLVFSGEQESTPILPIYIASIEITPVGVNYAERITLEKAQEAVNGLFTTGRNALKLEVTDYIVDQASILVDCISKELYPNEKRDLQSLVKHAKRLSISRNLLLDIDFNFISEKQGEGWSGWSGSQNMGIESGNQIFKGRYLHMRGATDAQRPTYLYQKIDESKLKEYTRYKLRGFIESSRDLEVYVIRYDEKHETLDVSNNLLSETPSLNDCGELNRCAQQPYFYEHPMLEQSSIENGILYDPHAFSLNIDTGSIDLNENLGIWVLFKIKTLEGYAKFGNVEVIEDNPLVGEALARVKRQETKWRSKLTQLQTETQAIYTRAKQALDNIFVDEQDSKLKNSATFATIVAARKIVQSIRETYMPWLSVVPGVNYSIFTELIGRIQRALRLYDLRNVVRNGRFLNGVSDWVVTSDVKVQEEDGNSVLVLPNWDAQVLQCVKLYPEHGYILRVTARKEGLGEGYVT
ncbi:insecticidal delta-endotoxin Cry8Ea1 family protein, partial [Bacillus cereus]|uniref:insecticidal delta-endotoxin Cry8Ea1 family protein n=1 Tax=Bacillus cereus TaxID=1396 RepID=UPI0005CEEBD6